MRAIEAYKIWENAAQRISNLRAEIEALEVELNKALEAEKDARQIMLVAAINTCYWPEQQWAEELLTASEKHWPEEVAEARRASTDEMPEAPTPRSPTRPDGSSPVPPSRPKKK